MSLLTKTWKHILDAFFPPHCPMCGELIPTEDEICSTCARQVVRILPPVCERCGRPRDHCRCGGNAGCYARSVSPFAYRNAIRDGIHRLKFRQGTSSADYFAKAMTETVRREYRSEAIDFVVCVPMHPIDRNKRGYNQSALLARRIAKALNLPFYGNVLVKRVLNIKQHTLTHEERSDNVTNTFEVSCPELVKGSTILLCDDVITTGSTLNQCSGALLSAGASRILCVAAAAVVGTENQES